MIALYEPGVTNAYRIQHLKFYSVLRRNIIRERLIQARRFPSFRKDERLRFSVSWLCVNISGLPEFSRAIRFVKGRVSDSQIGDLFVVRTAVVRRLKVLSLGEISLSLFITMKYTAVREASFFESNFRR